MSDSRASNIGGIAWSAIERFSIQGSQFVVSLIVARMLLPADYGLIAMMSIFIAISTSLIDSGMAQALIQRREPTQSDKTSALIFNIAVAAGLYAIIYISAPLIAGFYGLSQLTSVARIYSIVLLINSLSVVQQALIAIDLSFKRQAVATLSGVIIGGFVAIYMAWAGYGVWALVSQQIISALVSTTILWSMSSWRPHGEFSMESLKSLSRFGSKIMLSGLLHTLYTNLYTVIIGRHFAATDLGLYNRATTISALPSSNISTIVDRALYPILCREQADAERAAETLLRHLCVVCFGVFPIMCGIAIMAQPLTEILLGERWGDVTPLLQAVAVANMWDPIMKFMGSIIRSQGRSGDFLRAESIKKGCGVMILILSLPTGVVGMCWGLALYAALDMAIVIYFSRKISPLLGYINIIRRLLPTLLTTATMSAALLLITPQIGSLTPMAQLLVCFTLGATIYIGIAALTRRPELNALIQIIKHKKS